jgi:hypothetical protein
MTTYTTESVRAAAAALTSEATRAGIMPAGSQLYYSKGNRTNGISPCFEVHAPAGRTFASFLPQFTYKSTNREIVFALDAARLVLNAAHQMNN